MGIAPENWWQSKRDAAAETSRLEHGPAFGKVRLGQDTAKGWRTLRHDAARRGVTREEVGSNLRTRWEVKIGNDISGPVSAEGIVCVSLLRKHRVDAYDSETGKKRWSFTTGAR
jgi:hypothetical protein